MIIQSAYVLKARYAQWFKKFIRILCDNRPQESDAHTDSHCFVELSEKNDYLEERAHIVLGDFMNDGVEFGLEKGREYSRDDGMAEVQMQVQVCVSWRGIRKWIWLQLGNLVGG